MRREEIFLNNLKKKFFSVDKVGIAVDDYKGDPKITKKAQLSSLRRTKSCGDMPKSFGYMLSDVETQGKF